MNTSEVLSLYMAVAMLLWTVGSLICALLNSDTTSSMTETVSMATVDLPTRLNRPAVIVK